MDDLDDIPPLRSIRGVFAEPARGGTGLNLIPRDCEFFISVIDKAADHIEAMEGLLREAWELATLCPLRDSFLARDLAARIDAILPPIGDE